MFKDIDGYAIEGGKLDAETIRRNTFCSDDDSRQEDRPTRRQLVGRSFIQYANMNIHHKIHYQEIDGYVQEVER